MEREKSLNPSAAKKYTPPPTDRWLVVFILLFHVVGIIGFSIHKARPLFTALVPVHLLLMLVLIVRSHYRLNSKFLAFFSVVYLFGFFIEWVGTYTGWPFGVYSYGNTLGFKVFDVPLLIGVNWFLLVYSTGVAMRLAGLRIKVLRAFVGALMLTLLDWLIEPVAVHFDYWHWEFNHIPVNNYIAWFVISFILLLIFERFRFKKQSGVAAVFLFTQFVFFIALRHS